MVDIERYVRVMCEGLLTHLSFPKSKTITKEDFQEFLIQVMTQIFPLLPVFSLYTENEQWEREYTAQAKGFFEAFPGMIDQMFDFFGLDQSSVEKTIEYHLSSDHTQDGFFLKDVSGVYAYVNPVMAASIGRTDTKILGKTDFDLYTQEEAEFLKVRFEQALNGGMIKYEQTRSINGKPKHFLEVMVGKKSFDGKPTGVYGISRSILEPLETCLPEGASDYPSPAMQKVLRECLLYARINSPILLTGESGSGKDWLAQYIHAHSPRCSGPYFSVNCAAIAPELAESELFGYEKGAFTGAQIRKRGQLELAEGGTLVLNEIGELPLAQQSKLLTFLDTHSFIRVGGEKEVTVDAKLIALTHRDLETEMKEGRFLEPLFYRLNVIQIWVPPLRERLEDIPFVVAELLPKLAKELKFSIVPRLGTGVMEKLQSYHWPGNVRDLRNVLERAIILSRETTITVDEIQLSSEEHKIPQEPIPVGPDLRPFSHLSDEEFKQMYEEVCVRFDEATGKRLGEKGSLEAIATVMGTDPKTQGRRLNRLKCSRVDLGRPPEKDMKDLVRRLETWLTRHGFKCERASS